MTLACCFIFLVNVIFIFVRRLLNWCLSCVYVCLCLFSFCAPFHLGYVPSTWILPVYCVTSPCKDDRFKAPPPTPPGYQGLALADTHAQEGGVLRPAHLKPPDYNVALQRCKLRNSLAEPTLSRPPSVLLHPHADSEEGTWLDLMKNLTLHPKIKAHFASRKWRS